MALLVSAPKPTDDSDLLFHIEVDGKHFGGVQRSPPQLSDFVRNSVKRWTAPTDNFCAELLQAVRWLRYGAERGRASDKQGIVRSLVEMGYSAQLRFVPVQVVPGVGSTMRSHSFITVGARKGPRFCAGGDEILVEVDLKSEFKMQNPPPHYKMLLEFLPDEFVGSRARFLEVVCLMCDEMRTAFAECGIRFPPWREKKFVVSKWRFSASKEYMSLLPRDKGPCILA